MYAYSDSAIRFRHIKKRLRDSKRRGMLSLICKGVNPSSVPRKHYYNLRRHVIDLVSVDTSFLISLLWLSLSHCARKWNSWFVMWNQARCESSLLLTRTTRRDRALQNVNRLTAKFLKRLLSKTSTAASTEATGLTARATKTPFPISLWTSRHGTFVPRYAHGLYKDQCCFIYQQV